MRNTYGTILRFTSVEKTFQFLKFISLCCVNCESMKYKIDWGWRFKIEKEKYQYQFPTYKVITSNPERNRIYSQEEIETIITLKNQKMTVQYIANKIGRSYWSVVNKISELRKIGLL